MTFNLWGRLCALALAVPMSMLAVSTGSAQELLSPGQSVQLSWVGPNERVFEEPQPFMAGSIYQRTHICVLISTEQGQSYRLSLTQDRNVAFDLIIKRTCELSLGAGWGQQDSLFNRQYNVAAQRPTVVDFVSGGGAYYVILATKGGAPARPVTQVSLAVNGQPSGRALARGVTLLLPPTGAASVGGLGEARAAGDTFRDCPACPQMVVIPPGSFMMGSPDEEEGRNTNEGPRHVVTIGSAFAIGTHEVTFDEYDACVAEQACRAVEDAGWGRGRRPVINVRYLDAQRYAGWLSQKTGQRYFLPSEAEWEYVARAGSDTPWNTGAAIIASDANILSQYGKTVPVGSYPANAFGLSDTHGNVSEWTQDCMDTGYLGAPNDGSVATGGDCNARAVLRGGYFGALPAEVRSASRGLVSRQALGTGAGFRVTRAL